jgi:anaerobic magnesium-protoporphyrin IX monomethyl ester cyclase
MKEKVDILFLPAPLRFNKKRASVPSGDETSIPPIGIMYIASFLNSKGYNCQILDIGCKALSMKETIRRIKKINPRVIGISILTPSTITAVPLAREIRKKLPHILIGCGGTHVCIDPTFISRYKCFDFGVKGEGELIMLQIMKKLDKGEKIKGLYDGGYVKNLDSLPFPDYGLIDFKEYGYPLDPIGKRWTAISMTTSRGCPFSCSFCSKPESRRYVRYRSATNIVDEIEKNYPISRGEYSFLDDTMTLNQKNMEEVCRQIIQRKLKISWIAMTRADCLSLKLAKLMSKSGCRELMIGVESGDERVRNEIIKKRVTDKTIFKAIKICRQVGIRSSIFLMLGFPTEGKAEIEKTVNYPFVSGADLMGIHLTCPLPGSELWDQAIANKIIPKNLIDRFVAGKVGIDYSDWPKYFDKTIGLEYLEAARARALRKFYLSPTFVKRLIAYYLHSPFRVKYDKHLYLNGLAMLTKGRSKVQLS